MTVCRTEQFIRNSHYSGILSPKQNNTLEIGSSYAFRGGNEIERCAVKFCRK